MLLSSKYSVTVSGYDPGDTHKRCPISSSQHQISDHFFAPAAGVTSAVTNSANPSIGSWLCFILFVAPADSSPGAGIAVDEDVLVSWQTMHSRGGSSLNEQPCCGQQTEVQ